MPHPPAKSRSWLRWVIGGVVVAPRARRGRTVRVLPLHRGQVAGQAVALDGDHDHRRAVRHAAVGTAPAAAGRLAGTWKVGKGSTAGYRVQETLFGQSNTAVGRTTASPDR